MFDTGREIDASTTKTKLPGKAYPDLKQDHERININFNLNH